VIREQGTSAINAIISLRLMIRSVARGLLPLVHMLQKQSVLVNFIVSVPFDQLRRPHLCANDVAAQCLLNEAERASAFCWSDSC
jgi:hypothetical protein